MERAHELRLLDEAGLQGQQSEEKMAVGGGGHGVAPIIVGRSGRRRPPWPVPGIASRTGDYRRSAMPLHPHAAARRRHHPQQRSHGGRELPGELGLERGLQPRRKDPGGGPRGG